MNRLVEKNAHYDVLIVGGGMVGATLALALAEMDIRIALLDAKAPADWTLPQESGVFDSRVSALTIASRTLLHNLGVWDLIEERRCCPYERMHVWSEGGRAAIDFCAFDLGQLALGYIVENSVILAGLYQRLDAQDKVLRLPPATIEGWTLMESGARQLRLSDGTEISASLLVGADGAFSKVREMAQIATQEYDYQQQAIVTAVRTELGHQATAWQRFLQTGPLAFLPLQDEAAQYCSIVWSADEAVARSLMELPDVAFASALESAFEKRLGRIETVAQRFVFPLRQRHAEQYGSAGLALVGDAAHTIHPLAGQGVNLGLLDAAVLAEEVARARQRGIPIDHVSVTERYRRRRVGNNRAVMSLMTLFKRLYGSENPALLMLRDAGVALLNQMGPVKNQVAAQAMGLVGDLPQLAKYKPSP